MNFSQIILLYIHIIHIFDYLCFFHQLFLKTEETRKINAYTIFFFTLIIEGKK